MKRQAFQHPELRDANDNIIQQGAFGKNTALANATNDGWIDYVANDLEALYDNINGARIYVANKDALPATGDLSAMYIAEDTGKWYLWDGSKYIETDNARKIADEAIAARDAAKASATNAANSAKAAADSATAAATSASAAAGSASAAKTSETNAASSKSAAATSATNAANSAKAAADSATAAASNAREQQADWNVTDTSSKAFIKNKPEVYPKATADAAGNNIQTTYAQKSDLASSVSTTSLTVSGETSVPTANEGNSSNTIASTEFVAKSLAKLVDSAPESLNTLNELAKALGNDPNFATTIINELGKKMNSAEAESTYLPLSGGTVTGEVNINGADSDFVIPLKVQCPTLSEGHGIYINLGKEASMYNRYSFGFHYVGNKSKSNYFSFSSFEGPSYNFDCAGNAAFPASLTVPKVYGSLEGNADTATNATNDGNGKNIASTYLPVSGGTLTGDVLGVTPPNGDNSKKLATTEFVNAKAGNYLPLSGGTITGSIRYVNNGKVFAIGNTSSGNIDLGWNWDNREGAGIGLRSTDYPGSPGGFSLFARNANNTSYLDGNASGSLKWNNKEIERVSAKGTYGIRFESGIQICWGTLSIPAGTSGREVSDTMTFPFPFANNKYVLTFGPDWCASSSEYYRAEDRNTANFKFTAVGVSTNPHEAFYIAIGYWK